MLKCEDARDVFIGSAIDMYTYVYVEGYVTNCDITLFTSMNVRSVQHYNYVRVYAGRLFTHAARWHWHYK